jgi:hypothetical protein
MREGISLSVLSVVEMHQESNPAVLFFMHFERQHAVWHKTVKNQ